MKIRLNGRETDTDKTTVFGLRDEVSSDADIVIVNGFNMRSDREIKDGDDVLGRHALVKVVKNKVAPPFRRAEFDIMFGEGISKAGEIIDLGVEYDIIKKSGSWFSYNGSKLAQGRDSAKAVIDDNPELADEIEAKIMEALKNSPAPGSKKSKIKPKTTSEKVEEEEKYADDAEELDDVELDDDFNEDFTLEEE